MDGISRDEHVGRKMNKNVRYKGTCPIGWKKKEQLSY